jgi:hypothetical protein
VDQQEIERRFTEAFERAGLLKQGESLEPSALALEDDDTTAIEETDEADEGATKADPRPPSPITFINLFQHPDAHPYVLDLALLKKYGPEWMEWERETLMRRVPADFHTAGISDLTFAKLNGMKTLHYVDTFWSSWEVFVPVTMALNSLFPDFNVMQVPTVSQCAIAVDIADRVRSGVWSEEMKVYLQTVFKFDGIFCSTPPLDFVEIDGEDYPVDCGEVSKLWPAVRKSGKPPTGDTGTAEQLRRLLIVEDSLREHRTRIQAQLPLLLDG